MTEPARSARSWWLGPRRIGTQIATLVVLAALFTYAANTLVMRSLDRSPDARDIMAAASTLFSPLPVLSETDPEKRQAIVDLVNLMAPRLQMTLETPAQVPTSAIRVGQHGIGVAGDNGAGDPLAGIAELYSLGWIAENDERLNRTLAVLPDGAGAYAYLPLPPEAPPAVLSPQFMMGNWLVLLVIVLPIALVWAVISVARPLRRFARAAEEFSIDGPYVPLPETGPEEVQIVARSLNAMRRRIATMAADRIRMLSAIGHDLRTPVTRLRLRAEFVEDEEIRAGQLRDLTRMETMIDNTLSYLRDGQVPGVRATTDLVSLLQTLIDDFADLGANIELVAPDRLVCTVESEAIRRMVENLVQNSQKFGHYVKVRLGRHDDATIEIMVEDDGPGIAEAERQDMLKPFTTGDAARSETGFGLGLSIAEAIARAHSGHLELGDSTMGGLRVRIVLPCG